MIELGNLKLWNGKKVFIQIIAGFIIGITELPLTNTWINCKGWVVLPAGIDGHVHFRGEEESHKEDWITGVAAAMRGGYTLVADMPNKKRPNVTYERLMELLGYIGKREIDYMLWFGATSDNLGEIKQALKHPQVAGVKVYRGSSTGSLLVRENKPFWKIGELVAGMNSKGHTKFVATHNEDEEVMEANRTKLGHLPKIADHCKIRDGFAEYRSVLTTIQMQLDTGCPVIYCHISTPRSLEALHSAKQKGLLIFVEVCTHHMTASDRGDDPFGKVNPPLRTPEEVSRMEELVLRKDFADAVASDHAPHGEGEKLQENVAEEERYDKTPSGLIGVQTTVPLLLNKVAQGRLSWEGFIALTSKNYAAALGLKRGEIAPGFQAEFMFVDPNENWTITNQWIASKCKRTIYDGTPVQGAVKGIFTHERLYEF